jgi:hypothetical protein
MNKQVGMCHSDNHDKCFYNTFNKCMLTCEGTLDMYNVVACKQSLEKYTKFKWRDRDKRC